MRVVTHSRALRCRSMRMTCLRALKKNKLESCSSCHLMASILDIILNGPDFFFNVYFWETERERLWAGEGQTQRETQNFKWAPGSMLSAQSPTRAWTHKLWNHDLSQSWTLNRLSHPGTPGPGIKLNDITWFFWDCSGLRPENFTSWKPHWSWENEYSWSP